MEKLRLVAMVPAKLRSTRLAMKNLALIKNKPLIYYAIEAAKGAKIFDRIVVDAEDVIFEKIADRYKVDFYQRPRKLVSATTKTDVVVYDFILKNPCDIVAWISPIAPLQSAKEVRGIVEYFIKENLDSLMTVKNEQVHCIYKNNPINFKRKEIFAQTQALSPVQTFVYSVMMWRSKVFMRTFIRNGHALFCGKAGFYPVDKFSSIIVKNEDDLKLADCAMHAMVDKKGYQPAYDRVAKILSGRFN